MIARQDNDLMTDALTERMRDELGFVIPKPRPPGSYNAFVHEVIEQIEAGPPQFERRWFKSGQDELPLNTPATAPPFNARETIMFRLARQANVRIALSDTAPTYMPRFDVIHLPAPEFVFGSDDLPAAVAFQIAGFHEMIHWTGNKNRLRRFKEWSRKIVTIEEIAAELGAVFLCRDLGVTPNLSPRHAAYIAPYWQDLSRDAQALARAQGIAEAAVGFIYQEARDRFRRFDSTGSGRFDGPVRVPV